MHPLKVGLRGEAGRKEGKGGGVSAAFDEVAGVSMSMADSHEPIPMSQGPDQAPNKATYRAGEDAIQIQGGTRHRC